MSHRDAFLLTHIAPDAKQIPTLDGLRAVSIAIVILSHFVSARPGAHDVVGILGVQIFFVISGFLITRLLIAEQIETGRISLAHFYFRRVTRLAPALIACVLVTTALQLAYGDRDLRASACALLYMTNYCFTEAPDMFRGSAFYLESIWSLCVEEHFYLVFPLLLMGVVHRSAKWSYALVATACVLALAFRVAYALADRPNAFLLWRSESTMDLLMGGCLLSIMSAHAAGRAKLLALASTRVLIAATALYAGGLFLASSGKVGLALSQSALAIWLTIVVANLLLNPEIRGLRAVLNTRVANRIGRISYSLYLWHSVLIFIDRRSPWIDGYVSIALAIALSILMAEISYRWIEQPFLARRKQWAKRLGIGARVAAPPQDCYSETAGSLLYAGAPPKRPLS